MDIKKREKIASEAKIFFPSCTKPSHFTPIFSKNLIQKEVLLPKNTYIFPISTQKYTEKSVIFSPFRRSLQHPLSQIPDPPSFICQKFFSKMPYLW